MPPIPTGDEPALPKLRRFRFDTGDPSVAREVTDEPESLDEPGPSVEAPSADALSSEAASAEPLDDRTPPTARRDDDASGARDASAPPIAPAADDLLDSERLLAGLDSHAAPTAPRPAAETRPATDPRPVTSPHTRPVPDAAIAGPQQSPQRRGRWGILIGVAALVVAVIVGWFVLRPADETENESAAPDREPAAASENGDVTDWADGVCVALQDYQTTTTPLRAEIAQSKTNASATMPLSEIERQAGQSLTSLSTELQKIDLPTSSSEAATAHTTLVSAVTAAATTASSGGQTSGATVGAPGDAATSAADSIVAMLDRPLTVFTDAVGALDEPERQAVSAATSCAGLV